jgi:ABC-type amino acid transport substrate-binding protein
VALGANEIEEAFTTMAEPLGDLVIEPTLMLYYPFPLVFYLNPKRVELAARVKVGLQYIINNGQLDAIFNKYNGNIVERLSLKQRKALHLNNPILPNEMRDFSPDLLGNS